MNQIKPFPRLVKDIPTEFYNGTNNWKWISGKAQEFLINLGHSIQDISFSELYDDDHRRYRLVNGEWEVERYRI